MDPLSLCANIITVLQAAHDVITICYDFRAACKGRPWSLSRVLDQVIDLRSVLERLEKIAAEHDGTSNKSRDAMRLLCASNSSPLVACEQELRALQKLLLPSKYAGKPGTRRHALIESLGWRLKDSDAKAYLERIEKCKSTLALALSADQMTILLSIQSLNVALGWRVQSLDDTLQLAQKDKDFRRLLQWICHTKTEDSHQRALDCSTPGTGEWLLSTKEVEQFVDYKLTGVWLSGGPGAGKTVLSSKMISFLQQEAGAQSDLVAYFYCDSRHQGSCDAVDALGSIVAQCCTQSGDVPEDLQKAFDEAHATPLTTKPTLKILQEAITFFTKQYDLVLVIDALDECEDINRLCDVLTATRDQSRSRVFVTSRELPDIQRRLDSFPRLRLDDLGEQMDHDIVLYIQDRLTSERLQRLNPNLRDEIFDSLRGQSAGMFRWTQCQLDTISSMPTGKQIRQALVSLPAGLHETYARILLRIPAGCVEFVRRTLLWLSFSISALTLDEVHEAIAIDLTSEYMDEEDRLNEPQDVLTLCGSLVTISSQGLLSLAHQSVKDYLMSDEIRRNPGTHVFALSKHTGNLELTRFCLAYLRFKEFGKGPCQSAEDYEDRLAKYPLADHAARSWPYYARVCPEIELIEPGLMDFFSPLSRSTFMSWVQILNGDDGRWDSYPPFATSLYYASSFGLAGVVKLLIADGARLDAPGSRFGGTAVHGAVLRGHLDVVKLLLNAGADLNRADSNGLAPLQTALMRGDPEMIDGLLEWGAGERELSGRAPTHSAVQWNLETETAPASDSNQNATDDDGKSDLDSSTLSELRSGLYSSIVVGVESAGTPLARR